MPDLDAIQRLISQYQALSPTQRRSYNEAQTRITFIDPLFRALGWNLEDPAQVQVERSIVSGRADYAFKLGGSVRFYVEAKRLEDDLYREDYARQAITYAYNTGVGFAVLCNFARLVAFDTLEELGNQRPRHIIDLTVQDYLTRADLLDMLSPDGLQEGRLDQQAQQTGVRRRAVPIEKRLYQSLREWREDLFNDMGKVLGWMTQGDFRIGDEAIQRLLDRLIFLRHIEDRGISEPGLRTLRNRLHSPQHVNVTDSLLRLFADAAKTYDSELFQPDALIDVFLHGTGTNVDDTLREVVEGLYAVPHSWAAYNFALMPADVLGQVYEQYLGHVAQLVRFRAAQATLPGMTTPHIAVEAKRQRRKEQGIYYTPTWVVDYLVRQTVGRFIEEHTERPDAIDDLAILDPACGSGSFLIRAYEALLDHHGMVIGGDRGHLDRPTRERILRRNIFGVDLDPQAVEIARLNLLIRMVREEESLPPLAANIRHGNSLISGSESELRPYFGDGWESKRPFTWERQVPDIMARGGFDIVIGNPPYIRIQTLPRDDADYYRSHFAAAYGSFDIYVLFIERALGLLKPGGYLGFITSGKFLKSEYGKPLCRLLEEQAIVHEIVDLSRLQVFADATTYPILFLLQNSPVGAQHAAPSLRYLSVGLMPNTADAVFEGTALTGMVVTDQNAITKGIWPPATTSGGDLLGKVQRGSVPLREVADHLFVGLQTSADRVYVLEQVEKLDGRVRVRSRADGKVYDLESTLLHPLLSGKHINRYSIVEPNQLLLFPYHVSQGHAELISPAEFAQSYPTCWAYLQQHEFALRGREHGKMNHDRWYAFGRSQNLGLHDYKKLALPRLVHRLEAIYDAEGRYYLDNVDVGGILLKDTSDSNYRYMLALLNSTLLNWVFMSISVPFRGGFRSANRQFISPLPIHLPTNDGERLVQDQILVLVHRMLDLHQRVAAKGPLHDLEREHIEHELAQTDRQIDTLVCDLYGLTQEERRIVEEAP